MLCLKGLCDNYEREPVHYFIHSRASAYCSRWICTRHIDCAAVPLLWPVEKLYKEWKTVLPAIQPPNSPVFYPANPLQPEISSLMKEATTCYSCGEQGIYLCLHGGHMVCEVHSSERKCFGTLKSPRSCHCELIKNNPVWPNPFSHMYTRGSILHPGNHIVTSYATIKYSSKHHIECQFSGKISILSWAHPDDRFPRQLQLMNVAKMDLYYPAWRICIFLETSSAPKLDFNKCRSSWQMNILLILRQVQNIKNNYPLGQIFSYPAAPFMFHMEKEAVRCIWCSQLYENLELFARSRCSLYELSELNLASV